MRNLILYLLLLFPTLIFSQDFSTYEWEVYNTTNAPFPEDRMVEIMFDEARGLTWVTTSYRELYSYDGENWLHHPKPSDWKLHDWLNEIVITKEGKLWITGVSGLLISYEPKTKHWEKIPFPKGQPWVLRENKKGVLLIATSIQVGHLYQFHKGEFTLIEDQYQDAFEILFDEKGNAYVGFRKGCYLYEMNPDGTYSKGNGKIQSEEAFYDMEFDSKGVLWASSFSSLCLYSREDGEWEKLTGGPEKIYFDYNGDWKYVPHELVVLPDDRVLFSTQYNASIAIYGDGVWESYKLPFSDEDGIGRLKLKSDLSVWCGTWKHGLHVFKPTELTKDSISFPNTIAGMKYVPQNDGEKISFTPDNSRKVKTSAQHATKTESIQIEITDYQKVDGDTISLYFNGALIVDKKELSKTPIKVELKLQEGNNELLLFAHNLGSIPPNTAAVQVVDNGEKIKLDIDSDYSINGRILFRKE